MKTKQNKTEVFSSIQPVLTMDSTQSDSCNKKNSQDWMHS